MEPKNVLKNLQANNNFEVLVIGAGAAGLGAAKYLKKAGIKAKILEARDRIGGRVHAVPFGSDSKLIDLGGQWIHGLGPSAGDLKDWQGKLNPIYQIAVDNNIQTVKAWHLQSRIQKNFWYKGGEIPHDIWGILEQVEDYLEEHNEEADESETIDQFVKRKFNYEKGSEEEMILDWILIYRFGQDYGANPKNQSARYQEEDIIFDGTEDLIPESMLSILNIVAEGLDIMFNQQVTEINYERDQVVVKTKEGIEYFAQKVIVCVPLSILKAKDIQFKPVLPEEKQNSIQSMGVAQMDKLILEFDKVFWDEETDWFNYIAERNGDWCQTLNIYKYFQRPILMMFNAEPNTHNFEDMTDEEVLASGMKVIRDMFPNATEPINYLRTNWNKEEFSKGTFSYIAANSKPEYCEVITRNIDSKIWFAGEYGYFDFIGTVNAALISGENSAKEIVIQYNKKTEEICQHFYENDMFL
ncbi:amine oxidase [Stylonychia lemnae]|uniref:Amine oxidase n=1 Tax=Stylonychia lemnae TaxID=5949 RepID=A0A078AUQ4_STYLE|nr:amine oxidase [Stylonychia lemnae]|eukprot:CDW84613.1 amine oxidase [Stylonychia lemnae]